MIACGMFFSSHCSHIIGTDNYYFFKQIDVLNKNMVHKESIA
jgi:hypothetical protein